MAVSDGDIDDIQHQNTPLVKRRRVQYDSDSDDHGFDATMDTLDTQGITFHLSPVDRRIHATIVHKRHAGKIPQTLLQSVQFAPYVEFLATPAVLRALYSFGFGLGLSVMHCRRRLPADYVEASEQGLNIWDFSGKYSLHAAPTPSGYGDLTSGFIASARDFVISYNDHAAPDGHMARLLSYWVNRKLGIFRSRLVSVGIKEALKLDVPDPQIANRFGKLQGIPTQFLLKFTKRLPKTHLVAVFASSLSPGSDVAALIAPGLISSLTLFTI
ncbi:hypothetical protein PInf_023180 [Phytophthora infestans]|nr:hypothetical protein PInf_023180 [Phytophthora infestans]